MAALHGEHDGPSPGGPHPPAGLSSMAPDGSPPTLTTKPRRLSPGDISGIAITAVILAVGFGVYLVMLRRRCLKQRDQFAGETTKYQTQRRHVRLSSKWSSQQKSTFESRVAGNDCAQASPSPIILPVYSKFATGKGGGKPSLFGLHMAASPTTTRTPLITFTSVIASTDPPLSDGHMTPGSITPTRPAAEAQRLWIRSISAIEEREEV
ncbi:uncharacterized protein PHACADRAFT_26125 [Phanerochaete carnosa HHB-10118-sp]|uniref:Uncharacterized protein n=1 Tax=Phanerochaete carnosa (strain HHB-10118-sp) TaxID=650164 RepID=K5WDR2_PHACS|nr:uncharacterized protein PHACADRAFT_26125 [Phanerochaete carnosa HHB-10118-sp]EKM57410.1 hypothetical protein PHACADRAFT_26125 [Phanerochaete carnosa HHB-10118-sp]